ncbi:putative dienelactone hydrolase [Azospirillum lipoferum]|uniref:Alpha/beta fold hydrolase n=1 Tax=Azospirillum lipoferum TaxID=193 RepID=A0A5A9GU75_AZOLI|nr:MULTISPECIES: alpha/beta fold hydrolase [Azospirillum]KAA0597936.1 alpha/beta fold hydrolase [Azospirillum lipoferum]MCP1609920.1 putative dienelactone hydrolase [Azospirillum lipoferum]MDW5534587.1 alpha/beta fold hydrolase [Azospirillum sp. NL1]
MTRLSHPMLFALAVAVLAGPVRAESPSIGFQKLSLPATEQHRALEVAVWYPAEAAGETTLVGDYRVFSGAAVRIDAPPQPGRHRLVVLSHGYGGNWTNQQWLAADLAAEGYLVAAPNHPGSTSRDMAPPGGTMLWKRPGDISRVIDWLNGDSRWSALVVPGRAAVVGHSLGGWTAVALAGARFDPSRHEAACAAHPLMAACRPGIGGSDEDGTARRPWVTTPMADERIEAFVTLDLGLAQGFDPASLSGIDKPFLVIGAGPGDRKMPVELESRYLAGLLPGDRTLYVEIADASHFSFLSICKAGAIPLLEAAQPGDGMICRDRGGHDQDGRNREVIHRQVSDLVVSFLNSAMPLR